MKKLLQLITLFAVLAVAACGQRGDLYLPDENNASAFLIHVGMVS